MRRIILIIMILSLFLSQGRAQTAGENGSGSEVLRLIPVSLLMDRQSYRNGESLVVGIGLNDSSQLGHSFRVEIVNPYFRVLGVRLLKMDTVLKFAEFPLPDTISQGPYCVRAYIVFSDLSVVGFSKAYFEVINPGNLLERSRLYRQTLKVWQKQAGLRSGINVRVFPEGGGMLPGVHQRVAFLIRDEDNRGIEGDWTLMPDAVRFRTDADGWGQCLISGENVKHQYLVGSNHKKVLVPEFLESRANLNVNADDGFLAIRVVLSKEFKSGQKFLLSITYADGIFWSDEIEVAGYHSDTFYLSKIPLASLPEGWLNVELRNSRRELLAERFVPRAIASSQSGPLQIAASADSLELYNSSSSNPVWVTAIKENETAIESAGFSENSSSSAFAMRGWSRVGQPAFGPSEALQMYNETRALSLSMPQALAVAMHDWYLPSTKDRSVYIPHVQGRVVRDLYPTPVSEASVHLFDLDEYFSLYSALTSARGEFRFDLPWLRDSAQVILEAYNHKGSKAYVFELEVMVPAPVEIDPNMLSWFSGRLDEKSLPSTTRIGAPLRAGSVHGHADQVLYPDGSTAGRYSSVLEYLDGRVSGLEIEGMNQDRRAVLRGPGSIYRSTEVLYLIDDVPVSRHTVNALNPSEVERIEIIKNASGMAMYGIRGGNGVIAIYTRHGSQGGVGEFRMTFIGFHEYNYGQQVQPPENDIFRARIEAGQSVRIPTAVDATILITTFRFENGRWEKWQYLIRPD